MSAYTVKQLSELAGVSIRTLHHYDEIGLLKPSDRTESGYRKYGDAELLRLQQILFYRELEIPLTEVSQILDDPDFDPLHALEFHREHLKKKAGRIEALLSTIDKTIVQLRNKTKIMTDKEMYDGFTPEQASAYRKEAIEKWGEDEVTKSEENVRKMGKDQMDLLKKDHEDLCREMANNMNLPVSDERIQALVRRHYAFVSAFTTVDINRYKGLAQMYVDDPRFAETYNKYKQGLAEYLRNAILEFCEYKFHS